MEKLTAQVLCDKSAYLSSETISAKVEVTNSFGKSIILTFPNSQHYDFILKDKKGQEVIRWSKGQMFAMHINTMTLAANETIAFPDKIQLEPAKIQLGEYTLEGVCTVSKIAFSDVEYALAGEASTGKIRSGEETTFVVPIVATTKIVIVDETPASSEGLKFSGKDKTIEKALQKAIQTAISSNSYPDKMINYSISLIKGKYGGISGLNEIEVTINVTNQ